MPERLPNPVPPVEQGPDIPLPEAAPGGPELNRSDTIGVVGMEFDAAEQAVGANEAQTGAVDDEARTVLLYARDVIDRAGNAKSGVSLTEAIRAHRAKLAESGALSSGTTASDRYTRALSFAETIAGKVEERYKGLVDAESRDHPARSAKDNAGRARRKLFEGYKGAHSASDSASTEAEPVTRREKLDVTSKSEHEKIMHDPESVDEILDISKADFRVKRLLPARRAHAENPTPKTEAALDAAKKGFMGYAHLAAYRDGWKVARAEGDTRGFGEFMTDTKAAQDAEIGQYADSSTEIPAHVGQRMDQFDAAYGAFAGNRSHSFEHEARNQAIEIAQNQIVERSQAEHQRAA